MSTGGNSLVVQWLGLRAPNAGGLGSIPGQGTRSPMPQLRLLPQWSLGVLCAATETWPSQINKYFKKCVQGFGLPDSRV